MATVNDAPAELRHLAEEIPADIRERLDPSEMAIRLQQVARHRAQVGDIPEGETARGLSQHANAMLKALPYCELEQRCRDLKHSATNVAAAVDSAAYVQAIGELKRANPQPSLMTSAAHLADSQTGYGDLAASAVPEHRILAAAAHMITAQRPGAASAAPGNPRSTADHGEADVTKGSAGETVPFLTKAHGGGRSAAVGKVTRADIVKMVQRAVADSGMTEQLDKLAADLATTRAGIAGQRAQLAEDRARVSGATSTLGAPITKMRSNPK